jgi:very-short-patch-repair endonuclease
LRARAKAMRKAPTDAERKLWTILRAKRLGAFKFKRQVPLDPYIADFVCLQHRLIIEADGGQHAGCDYDAQRDAYLTGQGFRILRFWNNDISANPEGVATAIIDALQSPSPQPLSREGRGAVLPSPPGRGSAAGRGEGHRSTT